MVQTPPAFAIPGAWIPALPAGMTRQGLNDQAAQPPVSAGKWIALPLKNTLWPNYDSCLFVVLLWNNRL